MSKPNPYKDMDTGILPRSGKMTDEIDKAGASRAGHPKNSGAEQEIEERVGKKDSGDNEIHIANTPPVPLSPVNPDAGAAVGTSPVLQEMNGLQPQPAQANEQIFEEIPVAVCGQLYKTGLEVGFSLKNKGMPMRELPESRVKTQGEIIHGILLKNQISVKHIDLFMLGAGMMGDWKYMGTLAAEQEQEDKMRGEPKENKDGKYGEVPDGE